MVYVPVNLLNEVVRKYADWNIFGRRIYEDNKNHFLSDKEGFYEFEIDAKKVDEYRFDFNEKMSECYFINTIPLNY